MNKFIKDCTILMRYTTNYRFLFEKDSALYQRYRERVEELRKTVEDAENDSEDRKRSHSGSSKDGKISTKS